VHDEAGETLFAGSLDAGDSQTVEAPGPVTLTLGNAGAVTIQVNDLPLDTSTLPSTVDIAFTAA
jgi:hypothetical protein